MATLGDLKQRVRDDLDRPDLMSMIGQAVLDAIRYYQSERFWFNESRDLTFDTVADQRFYDASDAAWIPTVQNIDALFVTIGGQHRPMRRRRDPAEMELLSDTGAARGQPYSWAWFEDKIELYPIPNAVFPVRAYAHIRLDAPADDEASNAWTEEAFELIRCRTKYLMALHVIRDPEVATSMVQAEAQALLELRRQTSMRTSTGRLKATAF